MQSRNNDALVAQMQAMQMRNQVSASLLPPNMGQRLVYGPAAQLFGGYGIPTSVSGALGAAVTTAVSYDAMVRQMRGLMGGSFGAGSESLGAFVIPGVQRGSERLGDSGMNAQRVQEFTKALRDLGMTRTDALMAMQSLSSAARQVTKDMAEATIKVSELAKVSGMDPNAAGALVGNAMRTTGARLNTPNAAAFFATAMANAGYNPQLVMPTQAAVRGFADLMNIRGATNRIIDPITNTTAADQLYRQFAAFNPRLYGPNGNPEASVRQMSLMASGGKGAFLGLAMDLMPNRSIGEVFAALDQGGMTFPLRNAIARDPGLRDLAALSGLDMNFILGTGTREQQLERREAQRRLQVLAQVGYQGSIIDDLKSPDRARRKAAQDRVNQISQTNPLVKTTSDPFIEQAQLYYQRRTRSAQYPMGRGDFDMAFQTNDAQAIAAYQDAYQEGLRRVTTPTEEDLRNAVSPSQKVMSEIQRRLESSSPTLANTVPATFNEFLKQQGIGGEGIGSGPSALLYGPAGSAPGSPSPVLTGPGTFSFDMMSRGLGVGGAGGDVGSAFGSPGSLATGFDFGLETGLGDGMGPGNLLAPGAPGGPAPGAPGGPAPGAPGDPAAKSPGDPRSLTSYAVSAGATALHTRYLINRLSSPLAHRAPINGVRTAVTFGERMALDQTKDAALNKAAREAVEHRARVAAGQHVSKKVADQAIRRSSRLTTRAVFGAVAKAYGPMGAIRLAGKLGLGAVITGGSGGFLAGVNAALFAHDVYTIGSIIRDLNAADNAVDEAQGGEEPGPETPGSNTPVSSSRAPAQTMGPRETASGAFPQFSTAPNDASRVNVPPFMAAPDQGSPFRPGRLLVPGGVPRVRSDSGETRSDVSSAGAGAGSDRLVTALERAALATADLANRFERGDIKLTLPFTISPAVYNRTGGNYGSEV